MMRKSPLISIIIPVYNGANFLEVALQSAINQTYDNFEVIIIDDGSTDRGATEQIGRNFAARHSRNVSYHRQTNAGVGGALNTGLRVMRGEIFCWLSHDDVYQPNKLAEQMAFYQRLGGGEIVLFSDFSLIDASGQTTWEEGLRHDEFIDHQFLPLLRGAINGCTIFVPRSIFENVGMFDVNLRYVQDYHLWFRMLKRYSFFHQPQNLVQYRIHVGQDTNKPEATGEANALWIDMMCGLTEIERAQTSGSSFRFFRDIAVYLRSTPYDQAAERAEQLADVTIDQTLISIVMRPSGSHVLDLAAVRSIQAQTHLNWELLLAVPPGRRMLDDLRRTAANDPRIKLFSADRASNDGWAEALRRSDGEYITLLERGAIFHPEKLVRQVRAMQIEGWDWSATAYQTEHRPGRASAYASYGNDPQCKAICRSTIMVSRLFLVSVEAASFPPPTSFIDRPPNGDADLDHVLPDPLVYLRI